MADETQDMAKAKALGIALAGMPLWIRSNEFRLVWASIFKTRLGAGDGTITFCSISEATGLAGQGIVQEEVAVALSWPQLKALSIQLNDMVFAIENEMGEVKIPPFTHSSQTFREVLINQLKLIFGREIETKGKA